MSDLQADELSPDHQAQRHPATDPATTGGSVQYEALVQTLDEYSALLNCLLSALNEAGWTSNRA